MVSERSKKNVLAAAALGSSLAPFMVSALIVALPDIGKEFSAGTASLGWVTTIFFLSAAVFLVPVGRIADTFGIKKVFVTGIATYALSAILCIFSSDIQVLTGARFIAGIGAAMVFGTSIALVSLVFPEAERGRAIGINVTAMAVGFLLGSFLGGLLTFYVGWRAILAVTVPFEILIIALILSRLRGECEVRKRKGIDLPGMVLYGLALLLLMAGFSTLPKPEGFLVLGAGLACGIVFVLVQLRVNDPLLDLRKIFGNRTFVTANLTALLFNTSNFGVIFLMSLYLQSVRGIDARVAGIILLLPILFMAGLSPFAGRLADRIAPRIVIASGVVATSLSLLLLTGIESETPMPLILVALVLIGSGIALFQSPLVRTLVSSVPREIYGISSGMVETMRLVGMTLSIAISLIVFSYFANPASATGSTDLTGLRIIFQVFLLLSLAALVTALMVRKVPVKLPEIRTEKTAEKLTEK